MTRHNAMSGTTECMMTKLTWPNTLIDATEHMPVPAIAWMCTSLTNANPLINPFPYPPITIYQLYTHMKHT